MELSFKMRYTQHQKAVIIDVAFKAVTEVKNHEAFKGCDTPMSLHNAVWAMLAMMDGKEVKCTWDKLALERLLK